MSLPPHTRAVIRLTFLAFLAAVLLPFAFCCAMMDTMHGVDAWAHDAGQSFSFQGVFVHASHFSESPQSQFSDDSSSGLSYLDSETDSQALSAFGELEIDEPDSSPLFSDSPPATDYFSAADAHHPIGSTAASTYGSAASTPTPESSKSRPPFAHSQSESAPFQPAFSLYNREDLTQASPTKRHSPYPGHRSSPPSIYRDSPSVASSIRGAAMRRVVSSPVETQCSLDARKSRILALSSAMNVAGLVRSRTSMGSVMPTYTGPIKGGFVVGPIKPLEPVEKKGAFEEGWGASLPARIHTSPTPLAYPYNLAQPASPVRLHRSHSDVEKFPRPVLPSPYRQNSTPFMTPATVDAPATMPPRRRPSLISPMTPLRTSPVLGSRTFSY